MPAPSLLQLAKWACIRNIEAIVDVGDAPYAVVRPILLKVKSPKQLEALEIACPQLIGHDAELWREFIKRDVPKWETKREEPRNPKNWYKIYNKLLREGQAEVDKDIEALRAKMTGIKDVKAQHTSRLLEPSSISVNQMKKATQIGRGASGIRSHGTGASRTADNSLLTFGSGSRTKTGSGKDVLNKARREAKEMSLFSVRKSILATPTHRLNDKATAIKSAPRGLVDHHNKPASPALPSNKAKPAGIIAPRKPSTTTTSGAVAISETERERRLKAFTAPKSEPKDNTPSTPAFSSTSYRPQNESTFTAPTLGKGYATTSKSTDRTSATPKTTYPAKVDSPPPPTYKAPRVNVSNPPVRAVKKKAEADPFIPVKRRRVA
ncbi:MAG: hypothetical protein M1812_002858 [Candelaria pacifica]|nr:MAG: hypothetical protein M1812_002858 [Candelaria pacifica]